MDSFIGFTTITLVALITTLVAYRLPEISRILYAALTIRVFVMLLGYKFVTLPDSTFDAMGFEVGAWERAQGGFFDIFSYGIDSNYIKSIIAIPYYILGRSLLMAQSISLLFGMGSVLLGWSLARKLWDNHTAIKVGWVIALFPTLILYSVLTLREVYTAFFLLVAMHGIVDWIREEKFKSIILALIGFIGGTLFHGGIIIGAFVFFALIVLRSFKKIFELILTYHTSPKHLLIIVSCVIFLLFYISNNIHVPKLGTFEEATNISRLIDELGYRMKGDASYPEWTKIEEPSEFLYKGFIRILYLLYSPLPWHVEKINHLIGMTDGFLYIAISYFIFRNRKVILNDPALLSILLILLCYLFIFGIGTSNFGAGSRHRSKFVIEMIILAGPLIPKLSFKRKKNIK